MPWGVYLFKTGCSIQKLVRERAEAVKRVTIEQPGANKGDTKGLESSMRREEKKINRYKMLYNIIHMEKNCVSTNLTFRSSDKKLCNLYCQNLSLGLDSPKILSAV